MDCHGKARSDWVVRVTDGTTERSRISSEGLMVSSKPSVMPMHRCEGKRLQATH